MSKRERLKFMKKLQMEHKFLSISTTIMLIEGIIFFIVISVIPFFISKNLGPEKTAERYFTYIASGKYKEAYEMIDVDKSRNENELLTEEAFQKYCEGLGLLDTADYRVEKTENNKNGEKEVKILYKKAQDEREIIFPIYASPSSEKEWGIFEKSEIKFSNIISSNFGVRFPKNSSLCIDGKIINTASKKAVYEIYPDETDSDDEIYFVQKMFIGPHTIEITTPEGEKIVKAVEVGPDNDIIEVNREYLDENSMETVQKQAVQNMKAIYGEALKQGDFENIEYIFSESVLHDENMKINYKNIISSLRKDSKVKQIDFYNIYSYMQPNSSEVVVKFDYTLQYENNTSENYSQKAVFSFENEDGLWKQKNFGCFELKK